tara:strand:+ start:550 stop:690 length:141 start_codon:yes stop_codon:yes gene_type:complete
MRPRQEHADSALRQLVSEALDSQAFLDMAPILAPGLFFGLCNLSEQ